MSSVAPSGEGRKPTGVLIAVIMDVMLIPRRCPDLSACRGHYRSERKLCWLEGSNHEQGSSQSKAPALVLGKLRRYGIKSWSVGTYYDSERTD